MLSGNVVADISDGSLRLGGDAQDNLVKIALEDGDVVVRGRDGTTVNGAETFVAFENTDTVPEDVIARLGEGDDTLIISPGVVIGDDLKVYDREGATTLGLENVIIGDDVRLRLGNEADEVSLASTQIGDDLRLSTRGGDDLISIFETTVNGSMKAFTGSGQDDLVIQESTIEHRLRIFAGRGDDDVIIQKSDVSGHLSLRTWRGDDFVLVEDTETGRFPRAWLWPGSDTFVVDGLSTSHSHGHGWWSSMTSEQAEGHHHFHCPWWASPQSLDEVDPALLEQHVTDPETGAVAKADALRERIQNLTTDAFPLTAHVATNSEILQSNGTIVTKLETVTIEGETAALAEITIDLDGDGEYDDAATTADAHGFYSFELPLVDGPQTIGVRARDGSNRVAEAEVNVHKAVGSVVRFSSVLGNFDIELLDADAPQTVANFLNYEQRFTDSIIHRAPTDFVIQGGGFVFLNDTIVPILTDPSIPNEFNPSNSNLRGTLSMALQSGQPDSGTSGWFINVVDNPLLDNAKHTVFGRVIGDGMMVVDAFAGVPIYNLNPFENPTADSFGFLPLIGYDPLSEPLTGTVTIAAGGGTVTGNGTSFTTELAIGDKVRIGDEDVFVLSIVSNTEFTIVPSHIAGANAATAYINPDPAEENVVLFDSIGKIL